MSEDYQKIIKVIASCENVKHLLTAKNMVKLFGGKYKNSSGIRLYNILKLIHKKKQTFLK